MRKILNKIKDATSESPILNRGGPHRIYKFLRVTAHQQFPYQTNLSAWKVGRQIQLFQLLSCKYPISEKFFEYTGITLDEFFEWALVFFSINGGNALAFPFNPQDIYRNYPKASLFRFLNILSLDWQNAKQILLSSENVKIRDQQLQLVEQSPFIRYPFIKYRNGQYIFVSQKIFEQTINNFAYDLLKSKDGNDFSQEFGRITFESYLELGLKHAKMDYITESGLKTLFPKNKKAVDFTILERDCTVLVECKAIEMKPYTRVLPDTEIMSREFKSSVVKALEQIYSVINELHKVGDLSGKKFSNNMFALVVTYKELFFGPGQAIWDEFLKDDLVPYLEQAGIDPAILPPERIFYISLEGFDFLINILANSDHKLDKILEHIVRKTQDPQQMKFVFDWYINDDFWINSNKLPHLEEPTKAVFRTLVNTLGYEDIGEEIA